MSAILAFRTCSFPATGVDEVRLAEIDRISRELTIWMTGSEVAFLEAGERLRSAHGRIAQVRDGISHATEVFTRPVMSEARDHLGNAVECAVTVGRLTAERSECLLALNTAVDQAGADSGAMRTVFRALDYVVLIARAQIESLHSGRAELIAFARAVGELVASGAQIANAIDEHVNVLLSSLRESRTIDKQADLLTAETDRSTGFAALVDLIETHERLAGARRDEAYVAFTAIWQAVAATVMGLQSHDMARQRMEHTARNLSAMVRLARDGTFADGEAPIPTSFRGLAMRRVAQLEMAQTEDLSKTYGTLMVKLGNDLAEIADKLDVCGVVLAQLRPADTGARSGGLTALEAEASRLREEMRQGDALRVDLVGSLQRSVDETGRLILMTDKMSELEFQLDIAGFNAAIQAAHVEGGDETVGYIASVIREQALQARVGADKVRRGIEAAASATQTLADQLLPQIASAERGTNESLSRASAHLTEAEAESAEALDRSVQAAQGLSDEIRNVLDLMKAHGEGRRMMLALLEAIEAVFVDLPDMELAQPDAERLDAFLSAPYTMSEERTVFARVLGSAISPDPSEAVVADEPTTRAQDDFDDILF